MESSGRRPSLSRKIESSSSVTSSTDKETGLFKERQSNLVPLMQSPFEPPDPDFTPRDLQLTHNLDELPVFVTEVPWSDLLLEIAMTTAFASLTDGTPILEASAVSSYLSFFALVWWVWASQVAYNVRFRQSDWLHRFFTFLQLLVFCALAAFTNNFDMTNGIANNSAEQQKIVALEMNDLMQKQNIAAANYRNNRLPTLNARGISLTMGFSRMILLSQYILAFLHVVRKDGRVRLGRRSAFLMHIGTLAFSSLCYFVAYEVIGKNPDKDDQIAKLALWYAPLLIEVASHFIAATLPGRVRYPAEAIYARSSTVFIIILGGGLDKITNGFQFIVGNVSVGIKSFALLFCGAIIFTLLFTLYFGSSQGDKLGNRRALVLFFFSFFYLSAVIVTLQGIAAMLQAGNVGSALEAPFEFVSETKALMESNGFGVHLNWSNYSDEMVHKLDKTGVAVTTLVEYINWGVAIAVSKSDPNLAYNTVLQMDVYIIAVILGNFNAFPEDGSLLRAQFNTFYDNQPWNHTLVNNVTFNALAESVITTNATPALWFYAAGGSVLVTLALMTLINRWPRDRFEWGQTTSRLLCGSLIIASSAIDVNASSDVLSEDYKYQGSRIWFLATHSMILPTYAGALFFEQMIELALLAWAGRKYGIPVFSVFQRRNQRVFPHTATSAADTSYFPPVYQTSGEVQGWTMHNESEIVNPHRVEYSKSSSVLSYDGRTAMAPRTPAAPSVRSQSRGHANARTRYMRETSDGAIQPLISR